MPRQHFSTPITEMERLVRDHQGSPAVLGPILEELSYRSTERAHHLRAAVRQLLGDESVAASQVNLDLTERTHPTRQQLSDSPIERPTEPAAEGSPASSIASAPVEVAAGAASPAAIDDDGVQTEREPVPSQTAGVDLPFAEQPKEGAGSTSAVARSRQVFRFLRDYAERNTTIRRSLSEQLWTLHLQELPKHPAIEVGTVDVGTVDDGETPSDAAVTPLLRVRRPALTKSPPPPRRHIDWVRTDSESPFAEPQLFASLRRRVRKPSESGGDELTEEVAELREQDPDREAALRSWLADWRAWAIPERPTREAMAVFEKLYGLFGQLEREGERVEIMIGDGRLRRSTPAGTVDHPILLQRVEMLFDSGLMEFRFFDADRMSELYGAVLGGEDGIPGDRLRELQQELERTALHPLGQAGTSGFLKRIIGLLGADAQYLESGEARAGRAASIERDPVLFLRNRSSGIAAAMTRVLEDLAEGAEVPFALQQVVGLDRTVDFDHSEQQGLAEGSTEAQHLEEVMTRVGEPPDVLFAKPANLEQVMIARKLAKHGAVLVQGPPGTGKSHTISNLIGHLVANGDRVLVTSHTTKALRVLREHVPKELRPLCVALLDQDLEGRAQLEEAVRGIVERTSSSDEGTLEREASRLTALRMQLLQSAARRYDLLKIARESEYEPVLIEGDAIKPSEAAKLVVDSAESCAWMPDGLTPGAPLPLSQEELRQLYATNAQVSTADVDELSGSPPALAAVLSPMDLATHVAALGADQDVGHRACWSKAAVESDEAAVNELLQAVEEFASALEALAPWQRALVAAAEMGREEQAIWRQLKVQVSQAHTLYSTSRAILLERETERAGATASDEADTLKAITAHLKVGGRFGRFDLVLHPSWRRLVDAWRVNGAKPESLPDFAAISASIALAASRQRIGVRWERQAVPIGLPALGELGQPIEIQLAQYVDQFEELLTWWSGRWPRLKQLMNAAALKWDALRNSEVAARKPMPPFELDARILNESLPSVVASRLAVIRELRARRALTEQERALHACSGPLAERLRTALGARDPGNWSEAYQDLVVLLGKREALEARSILLAKLGAAAPKWGAAIRERTGVHGESTPPANAKTAWRWRQVVQELDRRAAIDEKAVARELEQERKELRGVTTQLIDRLAWLSQMRRTDGDARRALGGWSATQKKIGKGTGKRVPELQAKARELLSEARDAVPVWIMPMGRVAENFDPKKRKFDVVIVDEASQSDVTGLLAFYLGHRIVVVGDHEQVSPSAVGQSLDEIQHLIARHLGGIPNHHLYDGQTSIYDLARQSFEGNLALREHFRCVPDIIEFSNHLAYSGEMRPLRDPSTAAKPHVCEYVVPAEFSVSGSGKENVAEARIIASLIAAMDSMPEYDRKSIGVVTLVGDEQAQLVHSHAIALIPADRLHARRFVAGSAAQFQGDERDVILLSMVDAPSATGRALAFRDTATFKQRFNVAASRARDQMWLVHSLDPVRDLQPGDLRRRLIEHVRDPGAMRRTQAEALQRAESPFEAEVIRRLISAGYRVEPQVEVGRYRIDMVVHDGENRVAIECDGDRYHPVEQISEDIARQAVLERAGWRFVRIRGTRFYRYTEETMDWVFSEIGRLGVRPVGAGTAHRVQADESDLRDAVVRRAWEIMRTEGWLPAATLVSEAGAGPEVAVRPEVDAGQPFPGSSL